MIKAPKEETIPSVLENAPNGFSKNVFSKASSRAALPYSKRAPKFTVVELVTVAMISFFSLFNSWVEI